MLYRGGVGLARRVAGILGSQVKGGHTVTGYLQYQERQANTVAGPAFTSGAWRTVPFNNEIRDTGGHGSLSSDQITLDAGTYEVLATMSVYQRDGTGTAGARLRLRNTTGSADLAYGPQVPTNYPASNYGQGKTLVLRGRVTITVSSALELQIYPSGQSSIALPAMSTGEIEVYSDIVFKKVE